MASLGEQPQIHVFPTVGHSFLTDGHHPFATAASWPLFHIRWDPEVAEAGWAKILAFFDETL
jgi:carboxymethylenebutenolidase